MLKKWIPLWTIPVLICFAAGTVWLRLAIVGTSYSINEANHELDRLRQEREHLQVKITALKSPKRLEVLARTRFGLSQPRMDQVIHLNTVETN